MTHQERVKSFAHQKEARKLSKGRAAFGYLMEQGTGKSKTLVDDAAYHFSIGETGTRPLHHEGKVTGLAAFGEATLHRRAAGAIRRVSVTPPGSS